MSLVDFKNRAIPIRFLVERKFPLQKAPHSVRARIVPPETRPSEIVKVLIEEYEQELATKSLEELVELMKIETDAEELDQQEFESRLWFNIPATPSEYDFWCKMAYWTKEESIALSLCRNPSHLNWESIKSEQLLSVFVGEYRRRMELFDRAKAMDILDVSNKPINFLKWARRIDLSYPPELECIFLREEGVAVDWKAQFNAEVLAHNQSKKLLEEVKKLPTADGTKPGIVRERESLLKLVIGMAVKGYSYKPNASRNTATSEITTDLRSC